VAINTEDLIKKTILQKQDGFFIPGSIASFNHSKINA